ncbi:MAG: hypothetical protein M0026_07740 [Nocardiopsaceae bacterium]|nr:hypothetical protein [Nocardiopsaceae bacterium]
MRMRTLGAVGIATVALLFPLTGTATADPLTEGEEYTQEEQELPVLGEPCDEIGAEEDDGTGVILECADPGDGTAVWALPEEAPVLGEPCDEIGAGEDDGTGVILECADPGDGTAVWALPEEAGSGNEEDPKADPEEEESPDGNEPTGGAEAPEEEPTDLDGRPCDDGQSAPEDQAGEWACTPVYDEQCEITEYVFRPIEDGSVVLPEEQAALEADCVGDDDRPEEVPEDEEPETECGEATEGERTDGLICVCLDGDYGWYDNHGWSYYSGVWYRAYGDYWWYYTNGHWAIVTDDGVTSHLDADTQKSPAPRLDHAKSTDSYLPVTGSALVGLVTAGVATLGGGAAAMYLARRRKAAAAAESPVEAHE